MSTYTAKLSHAWTRGDVPHAAGAVVTGVTDGERTTLQRLRGRSDVFVAESDASAPSKYVPDRGAYDAATKLGGPISTAGPVVTAATENSTAHASDADGADAGISNQGDAAGDAAGAPLHDESKE